MKTLIAGALLATTLTTPSAAPGGCLPSWNVVDTSAISPDDTHLQDVTVFSDRTALFTGSSSNGSPTAWSGDLRGGRPRGNTLPPVPPHTWQSAEASSFHSPSGGWLLLDHMSTGADTTQAARWDGRRWTLHPTAVSPAAATTGLYLTDVASVSKNDAWAVGYTYGAKKGDLNPPTAALIEHWDGRRWSIVENPAAGRPESILRAVTAVSPHDVWAVGNQRDADGVISPLVQHFDGTRWTEVPAPHPTGALFAVSGTGPDDVWAVGSRRRDGTDNQATALVMHWDGTAWNSVTSLPDLGNSRLDSVYAAAPGSVWAVGDVGLGQEEEFLHWDGSAWTTVSHPGPRMNGLTYNFLDVHGSGPDNVWAVGVTVSEVLQEVRPVAARLTCGKG